MLKRCEKIEVSVLCAMVILAVLNVTVFASRCEEVRREVLRLHVVANSNSRDDQRVKLLVRDAVLTQGTDIFDGSVTVENAVDRLTPSIGKLRETALEVLRQNGMEEDVEIEIGREYFPTRVYDSFTLPAGEYMSVRVIIGSGGGQNWWCVMFPPLCLPAAQKNIDAYADSDGIKLIASSPKYAPAFKIVEFVEKLRR